MRSLKDIAELCFDYVDVGGEAGSTVRQKKYLCSVVSGVLQEICSARPEIFAKNIGAELPAPISGTATLVNGSNSATFSAGGADLRGLSAKIGSAFNQVASAAASPGNELVIPWTGSTGTHDATFYGDAVLLPAGVLSVLGNVRLTGYGDLRPVPDRESYNSRRDGMLSRDYGSGFSRTPRNPGHPEAWWAETVYSGGLSPQIYMRVAPFPESSYTISFDACFSPPEIAPEDIDDAEFSLPVAGDMVDGIVAPMVLQRWSASPWFRNSEAREEIARQFKAAKAMLSDWTAQAESGCEIVLDTY